MRSPSEERDRNSLQNVGLSINDGPSCIRWSETSWSRRVMFTSFRQNSKTRCLCDWYSTRCTCIFCACDCYLQADCACLIMWLMIICDRWRWFSQTLCHTSMPAKRWCQAGPTSTMKQITISALPPSVAFRMHTVTKHRPISPVIIAPPARLGNWTVIICPVIDDIF